MKNIKKFFAIAMVILSLFSIAAPALAAIVTGTYNHKAVHLRSTITGTSLGLVNKGASCNILSQETIGGVLYYKVKITSHTSNSPDLYHKVGWSQAQYITTSGGSVPSGPQSATDAFGSANLTTGSRGNYVRNVQLCLCNAPYRYYTGTVDGDFGNLTFSAVSSYQVAKGLTPDGIVGQATRNALWNDYNDLLQNYGY